MGRITIGAFIAVGVVAVMGAALSSPLPDRDSGVFLYVGSRILEGEIPYLDIWDHKWPLIYYINALAVLLSPGSEAGIWVLEAAALLLSGLGLHRLISSRYGRLSGLFGTAVFYGGLAFVLPPGNYTEEFSLPLQIAAILLFLGSHSERPATARWILIGVTAACALLLRPNNTGVFIAIFLHLTVTQSLRRDGRRIAIRSGAAMAGGAALVIGLVMGYLLWRGGLAGFVEAAIRYNAVYIQPSLLGGLDAVLEGLRTLAPAGIMFVALAAWVGATLGSSSAPGHDRLVQLALLALPIEMLLVAITGRSLTHYYIAWLPVSAILASRFLSRLLVVRQNARGSDANQSRTKTAWALGIVGVFALLPARRLLPPLIQVVQTGPRDVSVHADQLTMHGSEYLLMWGAETGFNYFSGLPSPTRYVYQYPLYVCEYVSSSMAKQFAEEVLMRRPLIVDTSSTNERVPPIDPEQRTDWSAKSANCALTEPVMSLLEFISQNYTQVGRHSPMGWAIYQYMDGGTP